MRRAAEDVPAAAASGSPATELPHQLIEELGLLLPPQDIIAARSTCRVWRNHLSQWVSRHPSGALFELLACADPAAWRARVASMVQVFPAVNELLVLAGGRVQPQVLDEELAHLAAALPALRRLEVVHLKPPPGAAAPLLGGAPAGGVGGDASAPPPFSAINGGHHPIPSGLASFTRLHHLSLSLHTSPTPPQLERLPTGLRELQLTTGMASQGVTDGALEVLGAHLPHLTAMALDVAPYSVTARGLRALPAATLRRLELFGIVGCSSEELQALTRLSELRHLMLELPSDHHPCAAALLARHPSLATLDLRLNQDEADLDPSFGELLGSLLAAGTGAQPAAGADAHPAVAGTDALPSGAQQPGPAPPPLAAAAATAPPSHEAPLGVLSPATELGQLALGDADEEEGGDEGGGDGGGALDEELALAAGGPSSWVPPLLPLRRTAACQLTALVLQSIKLVPSQRTGGAHFLAPLAAGLPALTSLTVAEPWVAGGRGRALPGSLTCLTRLAHLRTLAIALMPGFPIPALHVDAQVLCALSRACHSLSHLTALNAMEADAASLASLSSLTALTGLMLSPAPATPAAAAPGPVTPLPPPSLPLQRQRSAPQHHPDLPVLQAAQLPPVSTLCLTGFSLAPPPCAAADVDACGGPSLLEPAAARRLGRLQELVLLQCAVEVGEAVAAVAPGLGGGSGAAAGCEASAPPAAVQLLRHCAGLRSLVLRHVRGVHDGVLAHPLLSLPHLTALQLSAPLTLRPVAGGAGGSEPELTQGGMAHCARLTALRRLEWELPASCQDEREPELVAQLAVGARALQLLRLGPAGDAATRERTRRVVLDHLPHCCLAAT